MKPVLAILIGGMMLIWPAFLNNYPILFSDSAAFLAQTAIPLMIWDKPWVYGPFAWVFHQHVSLWGVVLAQGVIISHLLWLVSRIVSGAAVGRHLALCAGLAVLTTAPWSAALVMPDVLTPAAVLVAALLGWGWPLLRRTERGWLMFLGSVATASHLSNLPVMFALVVLAGMLRAGWGTAMRVAAPLVGAVILLLGTNFIGHGQLAISPYGSVFPLARLIADGPAARTIAARCPDAGWYLCAFANNLPTNSDTFLWHRESPVNRRPDGTAIFLGGMELAPEARIIVAETLWREPMPVLADGLRNFAAQLQRNRIGDTLARQDVGLVIRGILEGRFPMAEVARFDASLQMSDRLKPMAMRLVPLHALALLAAFVGSMLAWQRVHRARDPVALGILLCLLVGIAGNALATGALSMPHDRYQARIIWLLPVVAVLFSRLRSKRG